MARSMSKVKRPLVAPTGHKESSAVFTCASSGLDEISLVRPLSSDEEVSSLVFSAVALGPFSTGVCLTPPEVVWWTGSSLDYQLLASGCLRIWS